MGFFIKTFIHVITINSIGNTIIIIIIIIMIIRIIVIIMIINHMIIDIMAIAYCLLPTGCSKSP